MKVILLIFLIISIVFAIDRPRNYFATYSGARGDQQQVNNFAVWNVTSASWKVVIPHGIPNNEIYGIVRVGTGLLAYGSFTSIGSGRAAGLAYYNGWDWCAPEGVGLYTYTPSSSMSRFDNPTTGIGMAFAATVVGDDVYLLGEFNQVGLLRDGVAGFVKLTWTTGGVFQIGTVGSGYFEEVESSCSSSFCPRTTQPTKGSKNKLMSYTSTSSGTPLTFIFQDATNLFKFQPNGESWTEITSGSGARNLNGNIVDFDIYSPATGQPIIYVVGKFDNTDDVNANNQYLHIAMSNDDGFTFQKVFSGLPSLNFAELPTTYNPDGTVEYTSLPCTGLSAIAVESDSSIYFAGGWRVDSRDTTVDNLAGEMQLKVFHFTSSGATAISERFGHSTPGAEKITNLYRHNGILYALGNFYYYRQVGVNGLRFGRRYTYVMKGAAYFSTNGTWQQGFGGYLTDSSYGDNNPTLPSVAWSTDLAFFSGNINDQILSSYRIVSGGIFGYGGEKKKSQDRRWNSILENLRFTIANGNGVGSDGSIYALHLTKSSGDALIIGGEFDWIGSQPIGGVAWYSPDRGTVQSLGGGLFQYNNDVSFGADDLYNNRMGGDVRDFEERGHYLYAGGKFNRNNTGSCLSNIARIKFRESGAGWESVDGGCDARVNDLLIVGDLLYITGEFQYCGVTTDSYKGGLVRGRVPTNKIAVIDLGEGSKASWRNLGIGLEGGDGQALAYRGGDLFVGGSFSSAGGKLYTDGIARWRGDHWEDVVAKCRDNCDRPTSVYPYILQDPSPAPTARRPTKCLYLTEINGLIYCIDGTHIAIFTSNTWYQGGSIDTNTYTYSNSMFARNATHNELILVANYYKPIGANGANFLTYDEDHNQFVPSNGGFSYETVVVASSTTHFVSQFLILSFVILFVSYFF